MMKKFDVWTLGMAKTLPLSLNIFVEIMTAKLKRARIRMDLLQAAREGSRGKRKLLLFLHRGLRLVACKLSLGAARRSGHLWRAFSAFIL